MTQLLLDSAVVVWTVIDSPRLGPRARERIATAPAVFASAVTVAELTIKAMLGRIDIPTDLAEQLPRQGLRSLPLTAQHSETLRALPELTRHDPFDRLLLAQAISEGLTLLTSDRVLLGLRRVDVLDATA